MSDSNLAIRVNASTVATRLKASTAEEFLTVIKMGYPSFNLTPEQRLSIESRLHDVIRDAFVMGMPTP